MRMAVNQIKRNVRNSEQLKKPIDNIIPGDTSMQAQTIPAPTLALHINFSKIY